MTPQVMLIILTNIYLATLLPYVTRLFIAIVLASFSIFTLFQP